MKKINKFYLIAGMIILAMLAGCSDDDDGSTGTTTYENIYVHWMGDSTNVSFQGMNTVDLNGDEAIKLSSFITDAIVPQDADSTFVSTLDVQDDALKLYSYKIAGDDGFCASIKGYPNNTWAEMGKGYIMFESRNVTFPDDPANNFDIAGAYNIKETRHIDILRKFDVICNDSISIHYDLEKMPTVMVDNHDGVQEEAIALTSFLDQAIADSINIDVLNNNMLATSDFNVRSVDNWGPQIALTWAQFQTGYWLLESNKTIFTDGSLAGGEYKVKFLEKITIDE
ncbi:MAG: hypothetical protein PF638_11620 [Candidatus Delongbacteria bacterium]|jgi:hypothetical protein|nr:hypothetical protein [Candidatus Delongbacteria bacterium]